ncbi:MAG TPA: S24 family peptidase [Candidatus Kapabacteria bacterium]|nr:S24 family peptidase [Candidatus Kapabacteria bacterium]
MEVIDIILFKPSSEISSKMPFFEMSVSAGIPIPVDNDIQSEVDLNEFLVEHPATTFFAKVSGLKMQNYGVRDGDILIVDSSIVPHDGRLILASMGEELTVKIYREIDNEVYLESGNQKFLPLNIGEMEFNILGTVTKIIHSV